MNRLQSSKAVDDWNAAFPSGTPVVLTDDFGKKHPTKTRSVAWLLGSGDAVVMVEGRAGGYLLERIAPAPVCASGVEFKKS